MTFFGISLLAAIATAAAPLGPGDHHRSIDVGETTRSYVVHVPPGYDPDKPTPVVLAFHGAGMNGRAMVSFSGLSEKADKAGFVVAYPNGTGLAGVLLTWNAGWPPAAPGTTRADDAAFVAALLDDLASVVNLDSKRVFATGMSNGGMMCYRLASEMSDRIAAIAPVAGTLALPAYEPERPVPVIHFHGSDDRLVPFGESNGASRFSRMKSVEQTIAAVVKANGCSERPDVTELPDAAGDGTTIVRKAFAPGPSGAEVVLYVVQGGGHTWPGREPPVGFIGKSTKNLSANDLIWEFFEKHPMRSTRED